MSARNLCITGMHRSGTSMVAQLLREAGLWLGPDECLAPPKSDNPDGFFEHRGLVQLNDELLDCLGGAWDLPPPAGELRRLPESLVAPLGVRADELLDTLADGASAESPWGWKDPRASLVLNFWQQRRPDMRTLVCLRNPIAVARSLRRRSQVSQRLGLHLWLLYNQSLLAATERSDEVFVTHYDSWFLDPATELRRVAGFAGLVLDDERVDAIVRKIKPHLRHQQGESPDALLAAGGMDSVALYDALRSLAGPVYARCQEARTHPPQTRLQRKCDIPGFGDGEQRPTEVEVLVLRRRIAELDTELRALPTRDAPYRVGTTIDGRKGGNFVLYSEHGWAAPEEAGTWSIGKRAALRLPLHGLRDGSAITLHARVRPMIGHDHEGIGVALVVAGQEVRTWVLERPQGTDLRCTIDAKLLSLRVPLRLEFTIDRPRSPQSLGLSADLRPLGILLVSLLLKPVEAR